MGQSLSPVGAARAWVRRGLALLQLRPSNLRGFSLWWKQSISSLLTAAPAISRGSPGCANCGFEQELWFCDAMGSSPVELREQLQEVPLLSHQWDSKPPLHSFSPSWSISPGQHPQAGLWSVWGAAGQGWVGWHPPAAGGGGGAAGAPIKGKAGRESQTLLVWALGQSRRGCQDLS